VKEYQELKFEEALAKLEQVVRQLESGELTLDESLKLFESGIVLARICSQKLDEAEGKIQLLIGEEGERSAFQSEEEASL